VFVVRCVINVNDRCAIKKIRIVFKDMTAGFQTLGANADNEVVSVSTLIKLEVFFGPRSGTRLKVDMKLAIRDVVRQFVRLCFADIKTDHVGTNVFEVGRNLMSNGFIEKMEVIHGFLVSRDDVYRLFKFTKESCQSESRSKTVGSSTLGNHKKRGFCPLNGFENSLVRGLHVSFTEKGSW